MSWELSEKINKHKKLWLQKSNESNNIQVVLQHIDGNILRQWQNIKTYRENGHDQFHSSPPCWAMLSALVITLHVVRGPVNELLVPTRGALCWPSQRGAGFCRAGCRLSLVDISCSTQLCPHRGRAIWLWEHLSAILWASSHSAVNASHLQFSVPNADISGQARGRAPLPFMAIPTCRRTGGNSRLPDRGHHESHRMTVWVNNVPGSLQFGHHSGVNTSAASVGGMDYNKMSWNLNWTIKLE